MHRQRTLLRQCLGALALIAAGSCGSNTPPPTQPTPAAPQITCPADLTVRGVSGSSQVTTYTAPVVTGGASPVVTTCSPASGASFPLGTTTVNCTAVDAVPRQAACSFNATLTGLAIAVTTFGTFGDSLTEGETGRPNIVAPFLDTPNAYPTKLQQLLDATYPGQKLVVINRGLSGDPVAATEAKLVQFLPGDKPGAVLLLTGYNNLTKGCAPGQVNSTLCQAGVGDLDIGVRDCLRRVRESGGVKYTFISTLTPPGTTGSLRLDANAIILANSRIRQRAAADGAVVVDSYNSFIGHEAEYVNVDGLHLRPAGYQALADGFFAAIKTTIPQTPLVSLAGPR